jgi:hypothetical protein
METDLLGTKRRSLRAGDHGTGFLRVAGRMPGGDMSRFRARFFHDWATSTWLWADNDETTKTFGYDIDHHILIVDPDLAEELDRLAVWHDEALNWDDPRLPSPWGRDERAQFNAAVAVALERVRNALGDDWTLVETPSTHEGGD